ncbi:MAG: hypothetical protein A4S09_12935 [Proteobacteria bacterium SG_bin7]|nr:MAG: hypothetical protein A4S09_12935 [Proteobacteria bacterium SG_bin7]
MPRILISFAVGAIWILPFLVASTPAILIGGAWGIAGKYLGMAVALPIFAITFILVAGLISRFGKRGIVKGKFPRELKNPVYFARALYGAAWTQLFYFRPLYAVALAVPPLRTFMFRIFGYSANLDFTLYPDTWIRDLPILNVGKGAYLSNRSTIGTNMCLTDGSILVDGIEIAEKSMVGHLTMLAPGVKIGGESEVGVGCAMGIRVKIGNKVSIRPSTTVNHGCHLEDGCEIGTMSFIGLRAHVGPGIKIKAGANIPAGANILSQEEAEQYFSSETQTLQAQKESILKTLESHLGMGNVP